MPNYYKMTAGKASKSVDSFLQESFIGLDWAGSIDLNTVTYQDWYEFNNSMHSKYWSEISGVSKGSAGIANGMLWRISKEMQIGDIILMPTKNQSNKTSYIIGTVDSEYFYKNGEDYPHRRIVKWTETYIDRASMSQEMQNSIGGVMTLFSLTKFEAEINSLIAGVPLTKSAILIPRDEAKDVEDPTGFALESHLEEFIVRNWNITDLGKEYDIYYTDEDGTIGQQFQVDTGNIDVLAISKDKKQLLVIELKRGRASDVVVGQILRYMGYVKEVLATDTQSVHGIVIALEDDLRIRRALSVTNNVSFYQYRIDFHLEKKF